MTERYGYGDRYRDEPGGSDTRPSGRGAVAERRAGQDEEVREVDLTDEAAAREEAAAQEADTAAAAPGVEAGEAPPGDRESSGSFEPHPAAASTSIFDPGGDEAAAQAAEAEPAAAEAEAEAAEPAPAAEAATAEPAPAAAALDADSVRGRFLDIQAGFVDEPRQAVEEAGRFVDELAQQVIDALQAQRGQLQVPAGEASTEDLRVALRGYRQFVDRLLGLGL